MLYRKAIFSIFIFLASVSVFSQEKFTIRGIISDAQSNESLIGVNIIFSDLQTGTSTNAYGFYSITLPKGVNKIKISFLGFKEINETIDLTKDRIINYQINQSIVNLDEVVIKKSVKRLNTSKPQMSVNTLSVNRIKNIPVVLGEPDIVKAITLLPGVTSAGEGSSGFNVRGGAADQNLILLDEATIYNSSHLFGLFSVFNPDAIKDLKLYKGGIPSRYGGRVSSVLDIYQKEGNSKKFHSNGGIGLVTSRLLLEGPIKKDEGSFILGGRSSYAHLFLPLFDIDNIAYFYDLNAKFSIKLDQINNIYLSGYFGRDVFNIADSFENTYGNAVVNFRWNHLFSDKIFSNLSLIYSDYYYDLKLNFVEFDWISSIQNLNFKYDFKNNLSEKLQLQYGANFVYYKFNPGEIEPTTATSGINSFKLIDKFAFENAFYIDAEHKISKKLTASYGLRISSFWRLGQDELNIYENDNPVIFNENLQIYEKAVPVSTINNRRSEVIAPFNNLEPRLSIAYQLSNLSSVKASYNRMSQYLHLLSNTSSPTPLDIWTPSGKYIKPQILDQIAIGYFKEFKNKDYSLEVESYYKEIKNRIDYIDGADLIANNAIEQVILNGEARAYGLEILLRKNSGRFNGWLAYTLSKSEQRTQGRTTEELGINNGNWYRTPYDKLHDISFIGSFELNKKWDFNANFLFQTGQPTTFPNAQYEYNGLAIPSYSLRNQFKLPTYHRLDISAKFMPNAFRNKAWKSYWVFSVYNVYNRRNATSITFRENRNTGANEALRLSIFGVIPSISYNFMF